MWMQKSFEGGGMNVHDRNRFAQSSPYASQSYSGGPGTGDGSGDWKSKILESGQWLGGKVIEYGGKLARGASHDSIPEHMRGAPHNDGRASWMADIRNSSFTNTDYHGGGGGYGGSTYQNDFATERPKAYADLSSGGYKSSTPAYAAQDRSAERHSHSHDAGGRRAKKKSDSAKKSRKKSGRSDKKRRDASESEASDASESESDTSSVQESLSDASLSSDTGSTRRRAKPTKKHAKKKDDKKKKTKKKGSSFYSDDDDDDDGSDDGSDDNQAVRKAKSKKKAAAADNYSYSFDPSKLPPPPEDSKKSAKESKASRGKKGSKSRGRRQSVESSDSDVQQDNQKAKHSKRNAKKGKEKAVVDESVDLLGVDFDPQPVANTADAQAFAQHQTTRADLLTSVFDAQPSADPLQDLAGLSFDAPTHSTQHVSNESTAMFGAPQQQQQEPRQQDPAGSRFLKTLLPENDIVDLNSLASEKKPGKSAVAEKKTLNDLQKAKAGEQPVPVMAMNPHAAQQQQMMFQMNQMQLGHPAAMQMQMQPMQMQMPSQQQQQQQMMMMNVQMMQQQQQQQQQQQLLMQQQMMMGAPNASQQNAGAGPPAGAMFSSFQQ